jgi:hypothetical protein
VEIIAPPINASPRIEDGKSQAATSTRNGGSVVPRHANHEPTLEIAIPIVPMLDMTFQLLAFFIMTYRPSELSEGAVEFSLPASGSSTVNAEPPDPIIVSARALADVAHLTLEVRTGPGASRGGIVNIIVQEAATGGGYACTTVDALGKYLKRKHDEINPTNKNERDITTEVKIILASKLKQSEAMKIVDACLNVGRFSKIRFAPPTDDQYEKRSTKRKGLPVRELFSAPVSARDRTAFEAPPRGRSPEFPHESWGFRHRGRASKAVRSRAEPGTERKGRLPSRPPKLPDSHGLG